MIEISFMIAINNGMIVDIFNNQIRKLRYSDQYLFKLNVNYLGNTNSFWIEKYFRNLSIDETHYNEIINTISHLFVKKNISDDIFINLIGPKNSGKTSLINLLKNIFLYTDGAIIISSNYKEKNYIGINISTNTNILKKNLTNKIPLCIIKESHDYFWDHDDLRLLNILSISKQIDYKKGFEQFNNNYYYCYKNITVNDYIQTCKNMKILYLYNIFDPNKENNDFVKYIINNRDEVFTFLINYLIKKKNDEKNIINKDDYYLNNNLDMTIYI